MGDRLPGQPPRQQADLTRAAVAAESQSRPAVSVLGVLVLVLLAIDGVITAVLGAIFLQVRLGAVPFPVSALLSGLANAVLVWAALHWTSSPRVAALPLWTWLLTLAAMTLSGPGGDAVFGGAGFDQWSAAVLLILGTVPPGVLLWRRRQTRGLR